MHDGKGGTSSQLGLSTTWLLDSDILLSRQAKRMEHSASQAEYIKACILG